MNNLFVSLYKNDENEEINKTFENKKEYIKYNLLKYCYNSDILNNYFGKNMSLKINIDYIIKNINNKNKISIYNFNIKRNMKKDFRNIDNINVIFDNSYEELNYDEKNIAKKYIYDIFENTSISVNEIKPENKMYENDIKHIEEYVNGKNINRNKLKIIICINKIDDFNEEKIKEYISKYKFVDILKMPNINKYEYKKMLAVVDKINDEYGSTIEIISKKNIQEYSVYIMFSKINFEYFSSHYILRKRSKYIEMQNIDLDKYNDYVNEYEKNRGYITTLAQRLNIDLNRYSKNKIGSAIILKNK